MKGMLGLSLDIQGGPSLIFIHILLQLAECLQPKEMGFYPKYGSDESQIFRTICLQKTRTWGRSGSQQGGRKSDGYGG